jgi:N-acetylneuraminic acid mutarotase
MRIIILLALISLSACTHKKDLYIPNLPVAITNNAVALVHKDNNFEMYSFNGLLSGKTWQEITNKGYRYSDGEWNQITMPKQSLPVLASTAVSIDSNVYLIGGYTVNEKGEEKSVAEIFKLDTIKQEWSVVTVMPVPVDDTVALVYANRYIYLVSGWHDVDNVNLVQVYDIKLNKWFNASPFPAPAVFGHAGGIIDNEMVICDGVKVVPKDNNIEGSKRAFVSSPVCKIGTIQELHPDKIDWIDMPHHSTIAYYRMAATADIKDNRIVFVGGSDNPYNYNGIGYNGVPSEASNLIHIFDLKTNRWKSHADIINKTMDHRSLLSDKENFYIIGGMINSQAVSNKIVKFKIEDK